MEPKLIVVTQSKCFKGTVIQYKHTSLLLNCEMHLNVYLPTSVSIATKVAGLICLSGLTCNHDTFITKSGACQYADQYNLALICPDTSPRNINCHLDSESWDFGQGASYYVDATTDEYKQHYQMYSYITKELIDLIHSELPIDTSRLSIMGHSVGGHGALVLSMRNPEMFKSVSTFAPMSDPTRSPWGMKAFSRFLGGDQALWHAYSAVHLAKSYTAQRDLHVYIDQGSADKYLDDYLLTPKLVNELQGNPNVHVTSHFRDGYDHGYYFIQTFVHDHFKFHASFLS